MGIICSVATYLENKILGCPREESEEFMPLNKKKIRRPVTINGESFWVTADSEQEYAMKLIKLAGLSSGQAPTKPSRTFEDYATEWFDVFAKPNIDQVTAVSYERQLKCHILPAIGDKTLGDITTQDVQRIFNEIGDRAKLETKKKARVVLNQIFKMAVEDGYMVRNPLDSSSIKIKGSESTPTEPYTVAQMQYFAAHLNDIHNDTERAWLALCIALPLRPEEVLGLRWVDVDEENRILSIRSVVTHPTRNEAVFKPYLKTSASRRDLAVPKEIFEYLPKRGRDEDFVIGGEKPISYTKLRGIRKRIALVIGFDESITPRRFRTTVATDISANTHDLKLVQQMLGHATPQMTLKHYDKGRSTAIDAANVIGRCYGIVNSRSD